MSSKVLYVGRGRNASWTRLLAASGYDVVTAPGIEEALPLIDAMSPYVVLVEEAQEPARVSGVLALAAGARAARVVAVVSRTGHADAALAAGAHDSVREDAAAEEVCVRLRGWTRTASQERQQARSLQVVTDQVSALQHRLDELERENREMRELVHRDELTQLGNRRSFRMQLEYAIEYATRYGGIISVVLCDLDGMKRLNDSFGHPAGDMALRQVGDVLRTSLRGTDHAARLGGDEFGIVMPATPTAAAAAVAERVRVRLGALILPPGAPPMSGSFGVATLTAPRGVGFAGDELFARADAALYLAKRSGKDRVGIDGEESIRAA